MNDSNETTTKFLEIPYHLQRCPNCLVSASSTTIPSDTSLIGIAKLVCKTCIPYVHWQVCISCDKQNAHITTPQQLQRHFITFHNIKKLQKLMSLQKKMMKTNLLIPKPFINFVM